MTSTKTNSVEDSSSSKNTTQSQQQPQQQQHRRNWFFQRHNGGTGTTTTTAATASATSTATPRSRKGAAAAAATSSSIDETPKTNNRTITLQQQQQPSSATSTTTSTSTTATGTIPPPPINPPGILKKQTKDYDAIVASKQTGTKNTKKSTTISWLCRTKYFQKICHMAYEGIDSDQSGQIDEKELYAGLLLIHLQLGMYAGPAACRPLSRDQVHAIFIKMDNDGNGTLNETEFQQIMSVLFSNVLLRVIVQWTMTLMIVPWLAQFILNGIIYTISYITMIITNLDEQSQLFNMIELTIEGTTLYVYDHLLPNIIKSIFASIQYGISMVPTSVWKALPLTLLSTVLGIVVVPSCIFQIDTYFSKLADKYHSRYNDQRNKKKKVM
jgi:hypothetical protein